MNRSKIVRTTLVGKSEKARSREQRAGSRYILLSRRVRVRHFAFCILHFAFCIFLINANPCVAAEPPDPQEWVTKHLPALVDVYRHLHQAPELSLKEEKTAARMAEELRT